MKIMLGLILFNVPNTFTDAVHHKEKNNQISSKNTVSNPRASNKTGSPILTSLFFQDHYHRNCIYFLPLHINKLGSDPNFVNSEEVARGKDGKCLGEKQRTTSQEGLRASTRSGSRRLGKGLCAAVPGLQGRGRESQAGPSYRPEDMPA